MSSRIMNLKRVVYNNEVYNNKVIKNGIEYGRTGPTGPKGDGNYNTYSVGSG